MMKIPEKYVDVIINAIDTYGGETQTDMCIEECSELIKALLKFRRLTQEECRSIDGINALQNVQEEIADVQIMLWQIGLIYRCEFGCPEDEINQKIDRLKERVKAVGRTREQ